MFQRTISRSPAITASRNIIRQVRTEQHVRSTCAGAASAPQSRPASISRIARRQYAIRSRARKAPSTMDREYEKRVELEELARGVVRKNEDPEKEPVLEVLFRHAKQNQFLHQTEDKLHAFLKVAVEIDKTAQRAGTRPDGSKLKMVMDKYEIKDSNTVWFVASVWRHVHHRASQVFVERWLNAISDSGTSPFVTFTILHRALMLKEDGTDTFSRPSVTQARRVALQVIDGKIVYGNQAHWIYMFSSIEGKIEQLSGNTDRAITLFKRALELEPEAKLEDARDDGRYHWDVFAPWQYLAELYMNRYKATKGYQDLADFHKYLDIGVKNDDPVSHWQAAESTKVNIGGHHAATSKWLYHCLKAAASGHLQAAYALAHFYQNSGWRYIEDDPPDKVKPTPFDHKPSEEDPAARRGFFGDVLEFMRRLFTNVRSIGDFPGVDADTPHHALFHTAVYPSTAAERMRLAIEWLDVASDFNFAPAYLMKAHIHLTKTLWSAADAPAAALSLSDTRYDTTDAPADTPEDPANPYYSTSLAKDALREVFRACRMGAVHRQLDKRAMRDEHRTAYDRTSVDQFIWRRANEESPEVSKFFNDSYVWDQFANDLKTLYIDATKLCIQNKLDVYETDGILIFRGSV